MQTLLANYRVAGGPVSMECASSPPGNCRSALEQRTEQQGSPFTLTSLSKNCMLMCSVGILGLCE